MRQYIWIVYQIIVEKTTKGSFCDIVFGRSQTASEQNKGNALLRCFHGIGNGMLGVGYRGDLRNFNADGIE